MLWNTARKGGKKLDSDTSNKHQKQNQSCFQYTKSVLKTQKVVVKTQNLGGGTKFRVVSSWKRFFGN